MFGEIIIFLLIRTYIQRSRFYIKSLVLFGLHRRSNFKNLFHLIIKENYLIVLSDYYSIVINFNKITEHIKQLSLFSCTFKVFSIPLVKSAGKKVYKKQSYRLVERDTYKSSIIYMRVVSYGTIISKDEPSISSILRLQSHINSVVDMIEFIV